MKLLRFSPRILFFPQVVSFRRGLLLFAGAVLIALLTTTSLFYRVASSQIVQITRSVATEYYQDMTTRKPCPKAPKTWSHRYPAGARVFAYDVKTMRSQNPEAPKIPDYLQQALRRGAKVARSRYPLWSGGANYAIPISSKGGPCSLLYIQWKMPSHIRLGFVFSLAASFGLGLLICLSMGYIWIARPFFARIHWLAQTAKEVGSSELSSDWPPAPQGDLGSIETALAQAHRRILDDKAALASKNQALRHHFSNVAHDLRTPIASLQLALERLQQEHRSPALAIAFSDAVYLEQLVNNLGVVAHFGEGLYSSEEVASINVQQLLQRVKSRFSLLAQEHKITLEYAYPDEPVWSLTSPVLLERLISNLVHNAIRYNNPQGHVVILLQSKNTSWTIRVMDDGPGVPPEELPRLSKRAFRTDDARQREASGKGLGLAIVNEICHILNLELTFATLEPHGLSVQIQGTLTTPPTKETHIATTNPL